MIKLRALMLGIAGTAALAATAPAQTYYDYGYSRPPVVYSPPPAAYYYAPPYPPAYRTQDHYVPPGLSITTPLGTYAPFYGGWSPYGHDNVGGYDHYRSTPDR
jgi:hypothetical protein